MSLLKRSTSPGKPRVAIDDKELRRLYLERELSTRAIADLYGVSHQTIYRRLQELNIPLKQWRVPENH